MNLKFIGYFNDLIKLGFIVNKKDWYEYYDDELKCYIYITPIGRRIYIKYCNCSTISYSDRDMVEYKKIPEIVYDLILSGDVKKELAEE